MRRAFTISAYLLCTPMKTMSLHKSFVFFASAVLAVTLSYAEFHEPGTQVAQIRSIRSTTEPINDGQESNSAGAEHATTEVAPYPNDDLQLVGVDYVAGVAIFERADDVQLVVRTGEFIKSKTRLQALQKSGAIISYQQELFFLPLLGSRRIANISQTRLNH